MDEKELLYHEKNLYFKCIVGYIAISIIAISVILSLIISLIPDGYTEETKQNIQLHANIIVSFICNLGLAVFLVFTLRSIFKNDALNIKKNLKIFIPLVVFSFAFIYLGEFLCSLFYSIFDMKLTSNNQETLEKMLQTNLLPLMLISICITGPIIEEIVFRKCIFGFFNKNTAPLIISALAFGLLHVISTFDFVHVLPYIVTGLIFGGIYILSKRNIYATILAHMIANTVSVIFILL